MAVITASPPVQRRLLSPIAIRTTRTATGLVLFAYVLTHLLNHALGLISLEALASGRTIFLALWRNPPATTLLYGAFLIHAALAFYSLYRRRSLRMPRWEAAQLLLGLSIPPLLWEHVLGTRISHVISGAPDDYPHVLLILWLLAPDAGVRQVVTLVVAWVHGCIGLHYWLRLKPWYAPALPWIYGAALLVPVLALLGFAVAGREIAQLAADPANRTELLSGLPDAASIAKLTVLYRAGLVLYAGLLAGTLAARFVRALIRRRNAVAVRYPDGRSVEITRGTTILEASRIGGIPHASVCGGRGRCSTCRVRVIAGLDHIPEPTPAELKVLERVGAGPGTRLACQARPFGPVEVVPLLPPHASPRDARGRPAYLQGAEEEIAVLFCDLRDFTNLAEHRLPYDLVFLLNRFFRGMGEAVEEAGGRVDKFIGDGVMALFGIGATPREGCRQALLAARRMAERLAEVNAALHHELPTPLRIGIGIHAGHAIVGEMGYGPATHLTAVGDTVNTASRLETMTKDFECQLVLSQMVADLAVVDLASFPLQEVTVRGRREPVPVRIVADAAKLPDLR